MERNNENNNEFTISNNDGEITDFDPGEKTYIVDKKLSDDEAIEKIIEYEEQKEIKLTETTSQQRREMQKNKNGNKVLISTKQITVNIMKSTALGTAKGVVKTVENFDALIGALSYGILAYTWESWKTGRTIDAIIFGLIGILLVIAKHRLPTGGWISFLKKPVSDMQQDVKRLATDLYQTISGR